MRLLDQLRLDRERITYRVTFPVDMTEDGVIAWLHAASGAMKPASRFVGAPAMGFEVWSTNEGIVHRLRVPSKEAGYIISQLQGLVPGVHVLKEPEPPQADWTDMVELGLTHSSRTLNIPSIPNMAVSLLHSISPVYKNEVVMLQWVVTPALPQHKPIHREAQSDIISPRFLTHGNLANRDEVNDRRSKLEAPNFMAVLRVGVRAGAPVRAGELINDH